MVAERAVNLHYYMSLSLLYMLGISFLHKWLQYCKHGYFVCFFPCKVIVIHNRSIIYCDIHAIQKIHLLRVTLKYDQGPISRTGLSLVLGLSLRLWS